MAIAVAVAACGGDGGTNPNSLAAAAGDYELVTFDGHALPTVIFEDAEWRQEVLSELLVLRADGTFTNSWSDRYTHKPSGSVEVEQAFHDGTFTRDGQELLLLYEGELNPVIARLSGDELTIRNQTGAAYVFRRE